MVNILAVQVAAGVTLLVQRRLQQHHNEQLAHLLDTPRRTS